MSAEKHQEIEIKFQAHNLEALEASLLAAGFHEQTPSTFESNTLYDNATGTLRQAGEVLRLRQYGEHWKLTHKTRGSEGRHKQREEHETEIAHGEEMHAILTALGYRPAFRYDKFRAEWTDGVGEVVIDRTPIGNLAEIEGPAEWIDRTASSLHLSKSDYITVSYATLFFEWKARTGSSATQMTFEDCGTPKP